MNNLGTFYTNLGKTANKRFNSAVNSTNSFTKNAIEATNDNLNSVFNTTTNFSKNASKNLNSFVNSANEKLSNVHNTLRNIAVNTPKMVNDTFNSMMPPAIATATATKASGFVVPSLLFILIASISIYLIVKNKDKISAAINNLIQMMRGSLKQPTAPLIDASEPPPVDVTEAPVPPQDEPKIALTPTDNNKNILNKLLPIGNAEVFNVSKNEFPFSDAEPLCQALGAELATYDQVKEAWSKGADWCNYGWVKGQAAVYPIQEETWNRVQAGPEENRNSCGEVGLNGGYFENPDMKFGVNCYGVKPTQSEHDEELLMKQGIIPQTIPALEIDKKIKEFKAEATNLGVLPFNREKWHN